MIEIADEISEHADSLASAFTRVNEALTEPLTQSGESGSGSSGNGSSRSRRRGTTGSASSGSSGSGNSGQ